MLSLMELARRKNMSLIELINELDNSKVVLVCTEGLDTDRLDRLFEELRKENRNEALQLLCRTVSSQSDRRYAEIDSLSQLKYDIGIDPAEHPESECTAYTELRIVKGRIANQHGYQYGPVSFSGHKSRQTRF